MFCYKIMTHTVNKQTETFVNTGIHWDLLPVLNDGDITPVINFWGKVKLTLNLGAKVKSLHKKRRGQTMMFKQMLQNIGAYK